MRVVDFDGTFLQINIEYNQAATTDVSCLSPQPINTIQLIKFGPNEEQT